MTRPTTPAERMRAHREAFTLALELGCTPREAEAEIARRQARLSWLAADQRLQERTLHSELLLAPETDRDSAPWMMRD
jgi:hypothetical protein